MAEPHWLHLSAPSQDLSPSLPSLSAWLSFSLFTRNVPSQISFLSASPLAFIWYENWKNVFCWGSWLSPEILGREEIPWFLLVRRCFSLSEKWVLVTQSCPTLYDPMDCSPLGSSIHWIFQVGILEWVAISSPKAISQPRDLTYVSCASCIRRCIFYYLATQDTVVWS